MAKLSKHEEAALWAVKRGEAPSRRYQAALERLEARNLVCLFPRVRQAGRPDFYVLTDAGRRALAEHEASHG